MAYPLEATIESAIDTVELCFVEDYTVIGLREALVEWRRVKEFLETATGFDLSRTLDFDAADLYGGDGV